MSEQDRLAEIKAYREQHYIEPQMLGQPDWLVTEVERLRKENRRPLSDTPFCECGHSMYDHAMPQEGPVGECFVGGCGCSEYCVNEPFTGFRSGLSAEGSWGFPHDDKR